MDAQRQAELDRALSPGHGMVGQRLLSETESVRVWRIDLKPGERVAFHTHVLSYFWTALSAGRSRSAFADGKSVETSYEIGTTKHFTYGAGERMVHDLENIGETVLSFTTVELKIGSANAPLPLPIKAEQ
jgi:hypothetical protein